MATPALFTAADLNDLPEISGVTEAEATVVEAVVWGWLKPVLKLTERPDPVSPELFAWALELGAIYQDNPTGLDAKKRGPFEEEYGERAAEILRTAATGGATPAGTALSPRGSFPAARAYPDPAECY